MQRLHEQDCPETATGCGDDQWAAVREQQLSALRQQQEMQKKVSQLAASVEKYMAELNDRFMSSLHDTNMLLRGALHRIERLEAIAAPTRDPLHGIIDELTHKCGGNVHKNGVVTVTASSSAPGYPPENAVDLRTQENWFGTAAEQKHCFGWICYDFGNRRLGLTSYSIRKYNWGPGGYHPKSWVVEVSNEGRDGSWVIVDSRKDTFDLNEKFATRNFAVSNEPGEFRLVRLRLTGNNHYGDGGLVLSAFEVFGTIASAV